MTKKVISLLFAAALITSLLCVPAFAVGVLPQPDEYYYGGGYGGSYDGSVNYGGILPDSGLNFGYSDFGGSNGGGFSYSGAITPPYIASTSGSAVASAGGVPAALRVDAYSQQGGSLGYQWYSYDGYGGMSAIPGATGAAYTPAVSYGTRQYCVGVYAIVDGMRSDETFSDVMSVTYSGVDIVSNPSKTGYYVGDKIDLSGLVVNVYDINGSFWTSYNGNGLSVYPSQFAAAGSIPVEISDGYSSDVFYVNVGTVAQGKAANHSHEFGEWEITKEATCVTTGQRTRTCSCGEKETEELIKTEHNWDDGTITKEATNSNNGSRLYTCTICQANRSEIIPAGTQKPQPTTSLDAAAAANPNVIINQGDPAKNGSTSTYNNSGNNTYSNFNANTYANPNAQPEGPTVPSFQSGTLDGSQAGTANTVANQSGTVKSANESSGWWLIPVSALVLVGTGIGAYYLMQKRGGGE